MCIKFGSWSPRSFLDSEPLSSVVGNRSQQIPPKAVGTRERHFRRFFAKLPTESSDVISGAAVEAGGSRDVRVKFGDSWSNISRDIQAAQIVMENDYERCEGRTAFGVKIETPFAEIRKYIPQNMTFAVYYI